MDDLIRREDAIDAIRKACSIGDDCTECVERRQESTFCDEIVALRKLPSAQTKIIRCKDCKHFYFAHNRVPEEQEWVCGVWGASRADDDYCSEAKRRRG